MVKKLNKAQIKLHESHLEGMFSRKYLDAKMVWIDALKQTGEFILQGKVRGFGEKWRQRDLSFIVYLPKSWREGARYLIA